MTEEVIAPEAIVETPVEPIVPEVKEEPVKPEPKYTQEEMDRITAKVKKNATQRAKKETEAYYKGLLKGQEGVKPAEVKPQDKVPERDEYPTYEEFVTAKAEYVADKKVSEKLKQADTETKAKVDAESQAKTQQDFHTKLVEKYPDIESKLEAMEDLELPAGVGHAIATSEFGPDIINHFVENPNDAERISKLPSAQAIREIGRLEARFDTAKPPPVIASKAPTPIKPVVPSSSGDLNSMPDPNKNGGADWLEWRNKQLRKK